MVDSVRERIVGVLLTRTAAMRAYTHPSALPARGLFIGPDTDGQIPVYGGQQLTLTATLEQVESVPTPGADIAAFAAAVDAFHFAAKPVHPAFIATLQGGNHQFVFIGKVAVNTFSRDTGGLHQKVHARGGDAMAIDQLLSNVENNVAGFIAVHFVHVANSRTIVLHSQLTFFDAPQRDLSTPMV